MRLSISPEEEGFLEKIAFGFEIKLFPRSSDYQPDLTKPQCSKEPIHNQRDI
jgi:hypothetical protein